MFRFILKCVYCNNAIFCYNALKCVSINNQERKVRPRIINNNSNEPSFYLYSVKTNKQSGSWNNINDPYPKLCVPDINKSI